MVYEFSKEVRVKVKPPTLFGTILDVLIMKILRGSRYNLAANMKLRLRCYRDAKRIGWNVVRLYPDERDKGYYKVV